jgi:hypothetical protein
MAHASLVGREGIFHATPADPLPAAIASGFETIPQRCPNLPASAFV